MEAKKKISELTIDCAWNFCKKIIDGDFSKCNLFIRREIEDDFNEDGTLKHGAYIYCNKYAMVPWNIHILDLPERSTSLKIESLFHEIGHMIAFHPSIHSDYSILKQETGACVITLLLWYCFSLINNKFEKEIIAYYNRGPMAIAMNIIEINIIKNANLFLENFFSIIEDIKKMSDKELLTYNYILK